MSITLTLVAKDVFQLHDQMREILRDYEVDSLRYDQNVMASHLANLKPPVHIDDLKMPKQPKE